MNTIRIVFRNIFCIVAMVSVVVFSSGIDPASAQFGTSVSLAGFPVGNDIPNPPPIDPNLSNVEFDDYDVSGWAETSTLSSVTFDTSNDIITMDYDAADAWPPGAPLAGWQSIIVGNPWIFVFRNGRWIGATWEWLKQGQIDKAMDGISGSDYCGNIRAGELANFFPIPGERYGFMVSGYVRAGSATNIRERTNILEATWPLRAVFPQPCSGSGGPNLPPPPQINSVNPNPVKHGDVLVIGGSGLTNAIAFMDAGGTNLTFTGTVNGSGSQAQIVIPTFLAAGTYTVRVNGPGGLSNPMPVTIKGIAPPVPPNPNPINGPPAGLVCNPLPTTQPQLDQCIFWNNAQQPQPGPAPGSSSNPLQVAATGTWGVMGAFNPTNNTYLIAATTSNNGAQRRLVGNLFDAATNNLVIPTFRIDQGSDATATDSVGNPRIVYNPQTNQYLVAWEDERLGSNRRHIFGRIVNADGTFAGNDFPIHTANDAFLTDLDYDSKLNRYVVSVDNGSPGIILVDAAGNVGAISSYDPNPGNYDGQNNLTYNSTLNEYWMMYTVSKPLLGARPVPEDNQVHFLRINPQTMQIIGSPIGLSTPNPGHMIGSTLDPDLTNLSSIAYSPANQGALVVWIDGSKNGIVGRMVYDNGTLGPETDILTPQSNPMTTLYGAPTLSFNPLTGNFYMSALDNTGGTMLLTINNGLVINTNQVIGPPVNNPLGNPNPFSFSTGTGAIGGASLGYNQVQIGTSSSPPSSPNAAPIVIPPAPPTASVNPATLGQQISQIYLYALGASGLLAVLMIIIGGYYIMSAQGNAAQATKGREFVYSALIGVLLLAASFLILNTINPDLTTFDLSSLNNL